MADPERLFRCPRCKWHNLEPGNFWAGMKCPRWGKDNIERVE